MRFAALMTTMCLAVACKPAMLPNTEIEDTADTRAVYDIVDQYRSAMEARDANRVLALVAPDFFETSGTEDPTDDFGYQELQAHLQEDFERTLILRMEIHLKEIEVSEETATVTYRYRSRAQVRLPAGDQWMTHSDVNQMKLKKVGEEWRIVSGL